MTASENKQLVKHIFEQLAQGDTVPMIQAMSDDFRWVLPGTWSWSGRWEPKSVVLEKFLQPLMAQFQDDYRSAADLILADEDRVVVLARSSVTTKRGEPYHQNYCYIFRVAGGRLTEVVEYLDSALVEKLLDPPE
jgi:ketosteroid isomerase-like protein